MIESVPNAMIVSESSVSLNALVGSKLLSIVLNVQYIIGRPASEQSFSSEHELWMPAAVPTIINKRKIRTKFFIVSY